LQKHLDWFAKSYKPNCAKAPGVSAQPGGKDYYNFRIRQETTTNLNADQIHELGLKEVARIRADMVEVAKKAGYESREAFHPASAHRPAILCEDARRADGKGRTGEQDHRWQDARAVPPPAAPALWHQGNPGRNRGGTTTAYYNPGSPAIGVCRILLRQHLQTRPAPLLGNPALSVHEAVPGHHHQIALQQELELSDFRKNGAFFTAFTEGWGLYSERLGIEMGLYDTPAKDMGRLSYEMWRACRLVVDTGIHAKGWSKEQAIAFMTDNSAIVGGQYRGGGQPLYQLARTGAGLQAG
jgi:uncharacterized protein (DUF885 family)